MAINSQNATANAAVADAATIVAQDFRLLSQSSSRNSPAEMAKYAADVGRLTDSLTAAGAVHGITLRKPIRNVGALADSRFGMSQFIGGRNVFFKSMGLMHWLASASESRIFMPETLNRGITGQSTSQILARIDTEIALFKANKVDAVFVICGTNDWSGGATLAQVQANILQIGQRLYAADLFPIFIAETPRRSTDSEAIKNNHFALHQWYLGELRAAGYMVCDVWDALTSTTDKRVVPDGSTFDSQHGLPWWQKAFADLLWAQVRSVFQLPQQYATTGDVWSASNPGGSLTLNPLLTGTGGSKETGPVTGQIATGFKVAATADLTTVCSKEPHPSGYGEVQVLRITSANVVDSNSAVTFWIEPTQAPVLNDNVKALCRVSYSSAIKDGVNRCSLNLLSLPKFFSKIDGDAYSAVTPLPDAHAGSRETPVLLIDADTTNWRAYVSVQFIPGMPADCTVRISQFKTFKVV